ncbi:MAG: hypothetical protein WC389_22645 [Lutibacter sp.]
MKIIFISNLLIFCALSSYSQVILSTKETATAIIEVVENHTTDSTFVAYYDEAKKELYGDIFCVKARTKTITGFPKSKTVDRMQSDTRKAVEDELKKKNITVAKQIEVK